MSKNRKKREVFEEDNSWEEEEETAGEEEEEEGYEEEYDEEDVFLYTAPYDFVSEDGTVTVSSGDEIEVKCANCLLWEQPWGEDGPVRCYQGKEVSRKVTGGKTKSIVYDANKFTCESIFVPPDMKDVLERLFTAPTPVVLLIDRMKIGARKLLGGMVGAGKGRSERPHQEWLEAWAEKNGVDVDVDAAVNEAIDILLRAQHYERINSCYEMFDSYTKLVKRDFRKKASKKTALSKGDQITWMDRETDSRVGGLVFQVGGKGRKNQISVAIVNPQSHKRANITTWFDIKDLINNCDLQLKGEEEE